MYLNNAPFGSNIVGYQSAIYYYFQKKESDITWAQACTLAVLPNSPSLISPFTNKNFLIKKRNYLLDKLYKNKIINDEEYKLAVLEDIPKRK
jgi:penicillin-binding protein 1C